MTRLLYIHGIDGEGKEPDWTAALNRGLEQADRPPLASTPIAPDYTAILNQEAPPDGKPPRPTFERLDTRERARLQNEYARRASRLNRLAQIWPSSPGSGLPIPASIQSAALKLIFRAAHDYAQDERRRERVLATFLASLGSATDDLIVVAHSLGSVVALDLLYLLPKATKVRLLLTAGSPLAIDAVSTHLSRFGKGFCFDRVDAWVNVVEPRDFVTNGRGLSYRYPECLDVFVNIEDDSPHSATGYLSRPVVGEILGDVLHGSKVTTIAVPEVLPDLPPTKEQLVFVLRLHYAKRLELAITDNDRCRRFGAARDMVLDAIEQAMPLEHNRDGVPDGSVAPPLILRELRRDLGDRLRGRFTPIEALSLLLLLAMSRPLDPYDITTEEDEKQIAMRNVLDDLELKTDWAGHVLSAIRDAEDAHSRSSSMTIKVAGGTAIALGAAAAIAAPFLIVPFAAAGTAGAAAMTSGLAGIGALVNGGMAAGIAAITALAAGGGLAAAAGTAVLLAGTQGNSDVLQFSISARLISQSSAAEFTATVIQVQALSLLRHRLEMSDKRYSEWFLLASVQAEVAESRNRVESLSDRNSRSVKQWQQKQQVVNRALDWMRDHGLAPPEINSAGLIATPQEPPSIVTQVTKRIREARRQ